MKGKDPWLNLWIFIFEALTGQGFTPDPLNLWLITEDRELGVLYISFKCLKGTVVNLWCPSFKIEGHLKLRFQSLFEESSPKEVVELSIVGVRNARFTLIEKPRMKMKSQMWWHGRRNSGGCGCRKTRQLTCGMEGGKNGGLWPPAFPRSPNSEERINFGLQLWDLKETPHINQNASYLQILIDWDEVIFYSHSDEMGQRLSQHEKSFLVR